jgi:hypothetical protein
MIIVTMTVVQSFCPNWARPNSSLLIVLTSNINVILLAALQVWLDILCCFTQASVGTTRIASHGQLCGPSVDHTAPRRLPYDLALIDKRWLWLAPGLPSVIDSNVRLAEPTLDLGQRVCNRASDIIAKATLKIQIQSHPPSPHLAVIQRAIYLARGSNIPSSEAVLPQA